MEFIEYHGWRSELDVPLDRSSRSMSDSVHDERPGELPQITARPSRFSQRTSALERLEILGWDEV